MRHPALLDKGDKPSTVRLLFPGFFFMSALPGKKRCNDAVHVGNRNEVLAGIEDRNDIAYNLFVAALP